MRILELPGRPLTVLCLGAHSDDIEIGAGGTILHLLERHPGSDFHWVILSSTPERALEARESAQAFLSRAGRVTVQIATFRNSFFPYQGAEIKEFFEHLKRLVEPDLILTHHRGDLHQDHRLVAELTWNTFRNHLILEYEIPKYDGDLGTPNVFVCLDEATCQRKVDYLMKFFPSQQSKSWFEPGTFWALLRLRGVEASSPTRYAEAFYGRKIRLA